jgi:hypothetical protein
MPSADFHRFGRGATCRKFVARPRRAFSILQHRRPGRELAHRRRFPVETLSLAASLQAPASAWTSPKSYYSFSIIAEMEGFFLISNPTR